MYQLRLEESLRDGVRRIAREQIDGALESLREGTDRNEAVHEARKRCKKLRAVLRLVRDGLGDDVYRAQNDHFRDASRLLSAARDRWVLVETVEALQTRYGAFLAENTLASTRAHLQERHRTALERLLEVERADERAAAMLEDARSAIGNWSLGESPETEVVVAGVLRVYEQGRKALGKAQKARTTATFHDWRKRVKYLWYHSRLLRLRAGERSATLVDRLERLSRQLGEEHDLAVIGAELRSDRTLTRSAEHRELLLGLVAQRRSDLRESALTLGRLLYARKPGEVASRLERQWSKSSRDDREADAGTGERALPASSRTAGSAATVTRLDPARRRSS
jgi:CHAD domain-containing protein